MLPAGGSLGRFLTRGLGVLMLAVVWLAGPGRAAVTSDFSGSPTADHTQRTKMTVSLRAAAPLGLPGNPGIQPGGVVITDAGMCTLNFVFRAGDGTRYIGTAGHCILGDSPIEDEIPWPGGKEGPPDVTEKTWAPGSGPVAKDGSDQRLGEFAYAVLGEPKDFALIRLDPGVNASPQVAFFGGPTAIITDPSNGPVTLEYYGNGVGVGSVVPARSALALGMTDPDRVYALGLAAPGDSGSAVISSDGRAVGVLVEVGTGFDPGEKPSGAGNLGGIGITRLSPQLARAEQVLGVRLDLEPAPLN